MPTTPAPLQTMFEAAPPRYDRINRVVTWGLDARWRRLAATECLAALEGPFLDLCCGTGDLAIAVARASNGTADVTGYDYSGPMLDIARDKASAAGLSIGFTRGDAAAMPYPDGHFGCVGISFGFRNLVFRNAHSRQHLSEIARVVRPGGRFVVVESSQPACPFVRAAVHLYLRAFVGRVGGALSGQKGAYRYLAESAANFHTPSEIATMLKAAGFARVDYRPLLLGAAGLHVATR